MIHDWNRKCALYVKHCLIHTNKYTVQHNYSIAIKNPAFKVSFYLQNIKYQKYSLKTSLVTDLLLNVT